MLLCGHLLSLPAFADNINDLLNNGRYWKIKEMLEAKKNKTRDDLAVLSFVEVMLTKSPKAHAMAARSKGHYLADFAMMGTYVKAIGVKTDKEKAIMLGNKLYKKLKKEAGDDGFKLYLIAEIAELLDKNDMMAVLQKACDKNIAGALNMRGRLCQWEKDDKKALEYYLKAADLGLAEAQKNVSFYYARGIGCEKNMKKSFEYSSKAAQGGDVYGMVNLAVIYEMQGELEKARSWIEKAATSEHWMGPLEKGYALINGKYGYGINKKKGYELIKNSAESRAGVCFARLGELYLEGEGTKKNIEKAEKLFKCGYIQGDHRSAYALAYIYKNIKKDEDLIAFWISKGKAEPVDIRFAFYEYQLNMIDPFTVEL